MAYADKERQAATTAARKEATGRRLEFDYVLPSGNNAGKTVRELFESKINGTPDKCWQWIGKKFANDYGSFQSRGVDHLAHRVSFELFHGRPPVGVLMHTCDNRGCVNPAHLVEGTHKSNTEDMIEKSRGCTTKGDKRTPSKMNRLSDAQCEDIRVRRANGETCKVLAAEFKVTSPCISAISRGLQRLPEKEMKMTPTEYVAKAMRTNNDMGFRDNVIHAACLLSTESGEVVSEVKRFFAYGKPLDKHNIKEELGDLMWGIALMCDTLGFTLEDVLAMNIAKLEARYPNAKFNADHAINRDVAAEKAAMKGQ